MQTKTKIFYELFNGLTDQNIWLCAVFDCAESNFSNKKFEYLRENDFLRETI